MKEQLNKLSVNKDQQLQILLKDKISAITLKYLQNYETIKQMNEKEKINTLNNIGFIWEPLDTEWDEKFEKFKVFLKQNNKYPIKYKTDEGEKILARWIYTQRYMFKKNTLDKMKLDSFPAGFEGLQFEVFDTSVNMGKKVAGKMLQRALNILNRNERIVKDLKVDGIVGNQTISVIDKYKRESHYLFKLFVLIKAKIYIDILENNHSQEAFARGWINRISLNP